jgi:hypothetical protein
MFAYTVQIWDNGYTMGRQTLMASSVADAREQATEYAQDGVYDQPGTVDVQLTGRSVDERWAVAVGTNA